VARPYHAVEDEIDDAKPEEVKKSVMKIRMNIMF
jgi:hypothetical protein